ncbi:MAG TPA: MFS transporter [Thermoleophilaceae bacterium]|jgi:MFS family permease
MRRLLLLVSAIVLVDTMFYAAITPLLPRYSDELGLSKSAAGVLTAAYPAGTLLASLPSGWLAIRVGVRPTVVLGLALLSVSSVVFGLAEDAVLLDAARFVQGVGGAASWAGGLGWLVAAGPPERRGELIGTAFGAAIGGALLGPVLGAAANEATPEWAFGAVGAAGAGLLAWTLAMPAPARAAQDRSGLLPALRHRPLLAGVALIVLVGLFFGVVEVLVPLRLGELGAGSVLVAGTFLVTAGLQALASPAAGRYSDRRGALPLVRVALACAVVLAVALASVDAIVPLVALAMVAGPLVGMLWVPGMTILSSGAEAAGLEQALAFALVNLTWSAAQTAGAAGGGALADAAGDWAAYAAVTAATALALGAALRVRPAPAAAGP